MFFWRWEIRVWKKKYFENTYRARDRVEIFGADESLFFDVTSLTKISSKSRFKASLPKKFSVFKKNILYRWVV